MPLPENPRGVGGLGDQRVAQVYDLIAMDPRGTGGSTPRIACAEHVAPPLPRPDEAEYEQLTDLAREGERDCQERFGNLRPHVSTANTARDMDVVRAALGEDSLSYLGFSYGTTLGSVYGTLFPERLDRAVLDSAMPPEGTHREQYTRMAPAHTANVDRFTVWLAEHDYVYGLGEDAEEVHGLLLEVSDRLAADPREDVPGWEPLDGHGFDAIMGDHARYQQNWDVAADFVWRLANDEPVPPGGTPRTDPIAELNPYTHGVLMTVMCETPWPTDPEVYRSETAEFAEAHPFGPGTFWTVPQWCTFAGWEPAEPSMEIDGEAFDDALVVQAEFDAQTPLRGRGGVGRAPGRGDGDGDRRRRARVVRVGRLRVRDRGGGRLSGRRSHPRGRLLRGTGDPRTDTSSALRAHHDRGRTCPGNVREMSDG